MNIFDDVDEAMRPVKKRAERASRDAAWLRDGLTWNWPNNQPAVPLTLVRCCLWLGLDAPLVARAILSDPAGVVERAAAEGLPGAMRPGRRAA